MEIKTTVEESAEENQTATAPPDKVIDMAVEFGQMKALYGQMMNEMNELKQAQLNQATMSSELLSQLSELKSQATIIGHQEAQLSESLQDIQSQVMEGSESNETLEITPPMETHMEIDQIPVQTKRHWIQSLIYGSQ
jgi:hypothetical protein